MLAPHRHPSAALAVPVMVLMGGLLALQSEVNGQLAHRLGTGMRAGVLAATVSFGTGLVVLMIIVAALPSARRGLARVPRALGEHRLAPWHLVGGLAGAVLVSSQGLTVPTIGVALFTVAVVAGQTSSGLVVDHAGLGPSGTHAISRTRVIGAAITLVAVVIAASGRLDGANALAPSVLALALLPLVGGAMVSAQQAVNGRVGMVGGPLPAALINFTVGLSALVIVLLPASMLAPGSLDGGLPSQWWLYLGGPLGVAFVSGAAVLVRVHGVLVLGLATVAGQVVTSVLLDAWTGTHLDAYTMIGAAITVVGIALAAWGSGAFARRAAPAGSGAASSDQRGNADQTQG